jgi:hypothetical protein
MSRLQLSCGILVRISRRGGLPARRLPFAWNRSSADPFNCLRRPSDGRSAPTSRKTRRIDISKALQDPASVFSQPQEIVGNPDLPRDVKRRLLRQWERDARGLAVAEEEGMSGGEESMLGRVRLAIRALGEDESEPADTGTKHG